MRGLRPFRHALVMLPDDFIRVMDGIQPPDTNDWEISRTSYQYGTFASDGGPPNPFFVKGELDAAAFVRICRTLRAM